MCGTIRCVSDNDAGFRPLGEVFPRLRRGCVLGAVVGAAAGLWFWRSLQAARAGVIPPSVTNEGIDNPVHSYLTGVIASAVFTALCLAVLATSYRSAPLFGPKR